MKRSTFLIVCLLGFLFLTPLSLMAETWPDREFRVFMETPGGKKYPNAITASVASNIESWLKRVAKEYEAMGFKAPLWGHVDDNSFYSKKAYKVYVYPDSSPGAAHAAMLNPCAISTNNFTGKSKWIKTPTYMTFNSATGVKNGKLTTKAYQDLAHELFHAVQNTYDLFTGDCNAQPGGWIREGTAEAVGIEMARKLYPKRKPKDMCQAGMRRYDRELHTDARNKSGDPPCTNGGLDYQALSFWQFLGEYLTRKGIHMATEEFSPPDFRYLHNFFNATHAMGTPSTEYSWLNKALRRAKRYGKHQFGISLYKASSRFFGTFTSYWRPRRTIHYRDGNSVGGVTLNETKWMKYIFGKCEEVTVTKDASTSLVLEIMPVAARCIKMNFDFTGRVNLTFFATGLNQSVDLESLAISTDGGEKIVRRHPAEPHPDKIGKFSIDAKSGTPQYFIVSNVQRKDPGSTQDISSTFSIVPEFMSTSMAKAKKKQLDEPDPTEKEELENAWASRSWKGHARQREKSPCTKPFEYSSCGPITKIDLELLPDTAQLLDEIDEPTMSMERKMRVLDAIQKGEEQVPSDMGKALSEIRQQDGWNVRMQIPQIQPGFTGTVSNAHVRVEKAYSEDGSANGFWLAIGPGWVGPCKGPGLGYHPSSGQVEIAEFAKNNLRGTFSAKLVDKPEACQSAPIATTISGSFSITRISWGQAAPELSDDEILDQTLEDTNELLPGFITDDMREYIKEKAKTEQQKQEQSKQEKAADKKKKKTSEFQQCRCNCEMETNFCASNPTAECCVSCEPVFNACKGNQNSHNAALTAEEQAQEDTEVHTMRQQYEAYLESVGASGDMKDQMMKAFDDLKTVDEKRMLMMSLPLK